VKPQYRLKTVQAALDLVELFLNSPKPTLGVSEIAAATGQGKSEVYRLLQNLAEYGYVQEVPTDRKYRLGMKFLQVGQVVSERLSLLNDSSPVLDDLARCTGETVHLVMKTPQGPVCIAERQTAHQLRFFARIGLRLPWHAGSASKMLLATMPREFQEEILRGELPAYTAKTIQDADELRTELAGALRNGYTVSCGEMNAGARAVAAPIRDYSGDVVATVSVIAPDERADDARMAFFIETVVAAAQTISEQLGYRSSSRSNAGVHARKEAAIIA
jgi:IclR family transcriptional regulator, KDG regulon repressor